jgi:hypothetical protein
LNQFGEALEEARQSSNGRMSPQTKIERIIWVTVSMPRPADGRRTKMFTGIIEITKMSLRGRKR